MTEAKTDTPYIPPTYLLELPPLSWKRNFEAEALQLARFQIAHHQKTGEMLQPTEARVQFHEARRVQIRVAYREMVARLEHARRIQGACRAEFTPEPEFDEVAAP